MASQKYSESRSASASFVLLLVSPFYSNFTPIRLVTPMFMENNSVQLALFRCLLYFQFTTVTHFKSVLFGILLCLGITNTIGRIGAGSLADLKGLNSLLLHNIALLLGGITCILNMFCTTYVLMCVFAAVFGLCVGM